MPCVLQLRVEPSLLGEKNEKRLCVSEEPQELRSWEPFTCSKPFIFQMKRKSIPEDLTQLPKVTAKLGRVQNHFSLSTWVALDYKDALVFF